MEHLEHPSARKWEERRCWFENVNDEKQGDGGFLLSEQACALIADVQAAFCAGAWVAVIILSLSVIDAQLRETEIPGFRGSTKALLDLVGADSVTHRLRQRRNALVHLIPDNPGITVDQQWSDRKKLEEEARNAEELMFEVFYMSPCV